MIAAMIMATVSLFSAVIALIALGLAARVREELFGWAMLGAAVAFAIAAVAVAP